MLALLPWSDPGLAASCLESLGFLSGLLPRSARQIAAGRPESHVLGVQSPGCLASHLVGRPQAPLEMLSVDTLGKLVEVELVDGVDVRTQALDVLNDSHDEGDGGH